jgi:peptide/nickel transport system substrate-binding protein
MIRLVPRGDGDRVEESEMNSVNGLIQARINGQISRRELMRRAAKLGIAAPVVGVMLHATSDYAFGAPSGGRSRSLALLQETIPADAPTAPQGTPQEGGTITTGTTEEPDTLHPWTTQLVTGFDVYVGICEGLLEYDSHQELQPALAESFSISDDGLTYTFKLRQGVTFHNGDPFTPQDVIDSWQMIMNPDFGAFNQLGWDKITDIAVAEADPTSIVMTTSEIYAPFISYVGTGNPIAPASELAKGPEQFREEYGRNPIGTGPMKFIEWKASEQITLERNPDYWGGASKIEQIFYRIVPDDNTQLVQLRTGELQMCASSGAIGATRVDEALEIEGISLLEHSTMAWAHLDLKHIDFLRMTKVRQALDFATPSQQIIDQILKGRAIPSVADQAPGTWAYDDTIQPRPYDLDQAKALLAEAGLTPGDDGVLQGPTPAPDTKDSNAQPATGEVKPFEMELWYISGDSQSERIAQVIGASWNSIGIKTDLKSEDVSTIWGPEGYQFTDKMTACLYSWYNSNDPDDMFYWHSSQVPESPTGSGGNLPAYFFQYNFQKEIDDLTSRAAAETDQEARKALYSEIQKLLHEEAPVIFIYWAKQFEATANNIGGFWPSAFNNLLWNVEQWYLV